MPDRPEPPGRHHHTPAPPDTPDVAEPAPDLRSFLRPLAVGACVVVITVAVLCGYTLWRVEATADDVDAVSADVLSLQVSGEVAAARADIVRQARGDPNRPCGGPGGQSLQTLVCANRLLAAAGLDEVSDPGPDANSAQLGGAIGEARGALRALSELSRRGDLPGVNIPDPDTGPFPGSG